MKTEYDAGAAFLYPCTGRTGMPLIYALMLCSKDEKFPDICGFAGVGVKGNASYILFYAAIYIYFKTLVC